MPGRISIHATAAASAVFSVTPYTRLDRLPYDSIVMVDVIGPVLKYGDYCSFGSMEQANLLNQLSINERVKGIILNIDSPGGQADGTAFLADTINAVKKIKPVVSIIQDGTAASAAMWIAAACQEIYVSQATDSVGSIGAYTTLLDLSKYYEEMGVKVLEIYAPQSTDKNKGYYDALKGDESLIKEDLQFLVADFIKSVKTSRGQRLKTAGENPFTGKMYRAKEAIAIGLIDGIKPLAGVVKRVEQLIALRA